MPQYPPNDKETDDQLPTPVSTTGNHDYTESESDSSDSSSNTKVPNSSSQSCILHTISGTPDHFVTPIQRLAANFTSLLHKTQIKPCLNSTNYVAWSNSVCFGLSAASYDMFLQSDNHLGTGIEQP